MRTMTYNSIIFFYNYTYVYKESNTLMSLIKVSIIQLLSDDKVWQTRTLDVVTV